MLAFSELEEMDLVGKPVAPLLKSDYPSVAAWYERMKCVDGYKETHKVFPTLAEQPMFKQGAGRAQ